MNALTHIHMYEVHSTMYYVLGMRAGRGGAVRAHLACLSVQQRVSFVGVHECVCTYVHVHSTSYIVYT